MKKLLMLLGILALSTGMAVAQDTAPPPEQAPPAQEQAQPPAEQPADTDANVDVDADVDAQADADQEALPQTASPLPLIALLGLGSLAAGLASRRK
jgi:hypothetical protein